MIPFISVISTGNAVADPGEGPGGPDPRLFSVQAGARRAETEKKFFGDQPPPPYLMVLKTPPPPPLISRSGSGNSMLRWHPGGEGGGGTPIHYIIIRVCAAQRGCDFEASDLERCIHYRGVF